MKKAFLVGLLAAVAVATNAHAWTIRDTHEAMEPDENLAPITFRNVEWDDDSVTALKKLIDADGLTEDDYSINEKKTSIVVWSYQIISGQKVMTGLFFGDNGEPLHLATYSFYGEHSTAQQYYLDFCELYEALVSIYGEPTLNADQWVTDTYMGDESHYGEGLVSGCMSFHRGWMACDGSAVAINISGDNGVLETFAITYTAPGFEYPPIDTGL